MITDKNKEQFEKWWLNYCNKDEYGNPIGGTFARPHDNNIIAGFYEFKFEMQIGVYLAYYDSLGCSIETMSLNKTMGNHKYELCYCAETYDKEMNNTTINGNFKTRNEAYKEAFKKANEIVNK